MHHPESVAISRGDAPFFAKSGKIIDRILPMSQLRNWLRTQYGPGKRFNSARQLSLAVSAKQQSHNPNLVYDIESRGTAKIETLLALAGVLDVPPIRVFIEAGWISSEELKDNLLENERRFLYKWRQLSLDDQRMLDVMAERLLRIVGS